MTLTCDLETDLYDLGHVFDGLTQQYGHEQQVDLGHLGVFRQQPLQHGEAWHLADLTVDVGLGLLLVQA